MSATLFRDFTNHRVIEAAVVAETVCGENNGDFFNQNLPQPEAKTPDF